MTPTTPTLRKSARMVRGPSDGSQFPLPPSQDRRNYGPQVAIHSQAPNVPAPNVIVPVVAPSPASPANVLPSSLYLPPRQVQPDRSQPLSQPRTDQPGSSQTRRDRESSPELFSGLVYSPRRGTIRPRFGRAWSPIDEPPARRTQSRVHATPPPAPPAAATPPPLPPVATERTIHILVDAPFPPARNRVVTVRVEITGDAPNLAPANHR